LSPKIPEPKGQITKVNYRRALFLTPDELNAMMAYGASVCEEHNILDGNFTLRQLEKKNPSAFERVTKEVSLRNEISNCVCSSRSPRRLTASESCPGQLFAYCNLFSGTRTGEREEGMSRWNYRRGIIMMIATRKWVVGIMKRLKGMSSSIN